mgnify:CR=1 FL=1
MEQKRSATEYDSMKWGRLIDLLVNTKCGTR